MSAGYMVLEFRRNGQAGNGYGHGRQVGSM